MRMRLAFQLLLAVALASCSSHMGNDPAENSRQNSGEDSRQNSLWDSFWDVGASPWISPQSSRRGSGTAALRLLPAPVLLRLPPQHKRSRIRCVAPQGFSIGSFELLQEISGIFVQNIFVITDQGRADFPLSRAAVCFRCRYQSHNGSTWLESELSPAIGSSDLGDAECKPTDSAATARTSQNDPSWVLPVLVVGLLLLGAVVIIWRCWRGSRNQECWGGSVPRRSSSKVSRGSW